jgi:hypothetical protein
MEENHIVHENPRALFLMAAHRRAVQRWFRAQPAKFYNTGISKLVVRWDICLNRGGDYVEKQSKVLRTLPVF